LRDLIGAASYWDIPALRVSARNNELFSIIFYLGNGLEPKLGAWIFSLSLNGFSTNEKKCRQGHAISDLQSINRLHQKMAQPYNTILQKCHLQQYPPLFLLRSMRKPPARQNQFHRVPLQLRTEIVAQIKKGHFQ